jgi:hypothetical protein
MLDVWCALEEAYKWKRENLAPVSYLPPTTAFDDEINTWNGLVLALLQSSGMVSHIAVRLQAKAIESKADAIRNLSPGFPELEAGVWKDAITMWQHIRAIIYDTPPDTMSLIKKHRDCARAIVRLLESDA